MNILELNSYFNLKRHNKISIHESRIDSFFGSVGDYEGPESTQEIIGPVWKNVFGKFGTNVFELIKNRSISELTQSYEEYYINGISDGACAGKGLESFSKKYLYSKRNFSRLQYLAKHLELQHNSKDDFEEKDFVLLEKIISSFKIDDRLFEGQPWFWKINQTQIHAELLDHIYFADIILKFSKIYDWNDFTFLGDGSGILSSLIISNNQEKANYKFIDLVHFLIKQHLTNFIDESTSFFLAENFDEEKFPHSGVLINQDSFPEINEAGLKKYFNLIKNNKIEYVASYNQERYNQNHTNYRNLLREAGMESLVRFESTIRSDYFIEIFRKSNEL